MKKIEILAPAGSYESFLASLHAGCDAVYLGGTMFSARASAENFSREQFLDAIAYAHFYGRRVYMAVNTLLKEKEIGELPEYILPYYEHGLDAVIVQDLGVLEFMADFFPSMAVHLSTQLTLTGSMGAKLFSAGTDHKKYPVTRLVPARELSLAELRKLREETDLELEVFVHGALCVSYSGQCFFSSMAGGRSGNRGRCAQPCRKKYQCKKKGASYLLSPKDLCALEMIPELIEAGIDSFKIEGRMKKPEYAAYLSWLYRKYTDRFLQYGREEYKAYFKKFPQELEDDLRNAKDLYNRGGFTKGYFISRNGMDMMSRKRPNHEGVLVGTVTAVKGKRADIFWKQEINPQDIIEIRSQGNLVYEYTSGQAQKKGTSREVNFLQTAEVKPGMEVFRTRNNQLLSWIDENLIRHVLKKRLYGNFYACPGKEALLTIWANREGFGTFADQNITVTVTGSICQEAEKQPLDAKAVRRQLSKLGDTEFIWEMLTIQIEGNVFLSVKSLNELRRQALWEFQEAYRKSFFQKAEKKKTLIVLNGTGRKIEQKGHRKPQIAAEVLTAEQWHAALSSGCVYIIYVRMEILEKKEILSLAEETIKKGKKCFLSMPAILREADRKLVKEILSMLFSKRLCSGILLHNLEELGFFTELCRTGEIEGLKETELTADFSMYSTNSLAIKFWEEHGCRRVTASVEQNFQELSELFSKETRGIEAECLIYGRLPLMTLAQCIVSHGNGRDCIKSPEVLMLRDERKETMYGRNFCRFCYNILYSGKVCDLRQNAQELLQIPFEVWRCSFTEETKEEAASVLGSVDMILNGKGIAAQEDVWTGHFHRGMI